MLPAPMEFDATGAVVGIGWVDDEELLFELQAAPATTRTTPIRTPAVMRDPASPRLSTRCIVASLGS
jgi:hypothetical protein